MRVGGGDAAKEIDAVEEPRVEEVRRLTAGFESVGSEGDDVGAQAGF